MSYHPVDIYVGKRLKEKRIEKGLSREELANALTIVRAMIDIGSVNFKANHIKDYESGKVKVGSSHLYEISRLLGVAVGYFFQGFENTVNYPAAS